jgi:hypothetical protein
MALPVSFCTFYDTDCTFLDTNRTLLSTVCSLSLVENSDVFGRL